MWSKKLNSFFWKKIFSKTFQKIQNFDFSKFWKFRFSLTFQKNRKSDFWKIKILNFLIFFWKYFFSENRVEFFWPQKVFGCNFSKNKYFYLNPKAYEAAWPWLSFPLLDIKNGPLHKKLSRFFVRGESITVTSRKNDRSLSRKKSNPSRLTHHSKPSFFRDFFSRGASHHFTAIILAGFFFTPKGKIHHFSEIVFFREERIMSAFCGVLLYCCFIGSWNSARKADDRRGWGVS